MRPVSFARIAAAAMALSSCLSPEALLPCSSDEGCPTGEVCRSGECVAMATDVEPNARADNAVEDAREPPFADTSSDADTSTDGVTTVDGPPGDAALTPDVAPMTDAAPNLDAAQPADVPQGGVAPPDATPDAAPVDDALHPPADVGCMTADGACGDELGCDAGVGESQTPGAPCELVRDLCRLPGVWACEVGRGAVCVPAAVLDEVACNALDDDCDGAVDEGNAALIGRPCVEEDALGACRNGRFQCVRGEAVCFVDLERPETCNGVDDDCDGRNDEGTTGSTGEDGVCSVRERTCRAGVPGVEPMLDDLQDFEPMDARCDGLDNDCDGRVDEGVPQGPVCFLGQGVCRVPGTMACVRGAMECLGPLGEPPSLFDPTCDGLDEDCDGKSDEDYASLTCGEGRCAATSIPSECVEGVEMPCRPGEPVAESCNGVDDDCNGVVDDATPMPAVPLRIREGIRSIGPPGLVFDGDRFVLAFWDDGTPPEFTVAAVGMDDEVVVAPTRIVQSSANDPPLTGSPKLLASADSTLIVWQDRLGNDTSQHHISTARLARNGEVSDEVRTTITGVYVPDPMPRYALHQPSISRLPDGNYLVVYSRAIPGGTQNIEAQVLSPALDARIGNALLVGSSVGDSTVEMVAMDESSFVLGWWGEDGLQAARVGYAAGVVSVVEGARLVSMESVGRRGVVRSAFSLVQTTLGVAMVWPQGAASPTPGIRWVHFDRSLDQVQGPLRITDTVAFDPSIAWTGHSFGLVWSEVRNADGVGDLWFQRLDSRGGGVGAAGRVIEGLPPVGAYSASLLWTGTEFAVAYSGSYLDPAPIGFRVDAFFAHGLFGTCPD